MPHKITPLPPKPKPHYVQPDRSKIHFELYGKGGPTLVLIHGYMANRLMFDPVIGDLAQHFRTVVLDNRGFGLSAHLEGPYTVEQFATDAVGVLDDLGVRDAHVLGYSMGGLIAQEMALRHPQRVDKLALTVTFSYKQMTALERMQRNFLPTVIKRLGGKGLSRAMYDGIAGGVNMDPRDFAAFKKMLAECRDDVLLQAGHSLFKFDSRDHLYKIQHPTLVLGAQDDIVVPVHHARYLAQNLPNANLKVLERGGHGAIYTHTHKLLRHIKHHFLHPAE
jgi:pimeloyl-ACP methyl ester carboxylesterase